MYAHENVECAEVASPSDDRGQVRQASNSIIYKRNLRWTLMQRSMSGIASFNLADDFSQRILCSVPMQINVFLRPHVLLDSQPWHIKSSHQDWLSQFNVPGRWAGSCEAPTLTNTSVKKMTSNLRAITTFRHFHFSIDFNGCFKNLRLCHLKRALYLSQTSC